MTLVFIMPPLETATTQSFGKFPLEIFFRLRKINIGLSFQPGDRAVRTTENLIFSLPVPLVRTLFTPSKSRVLVSGISNHIGLSSMLPIAMSLKNVSLIFLLCICHEHLRHSWGIGWDFLANTCHSSAKTSFLHFRELLNHPADALNPVAPLL